MLMVGTHDFQSMRPHNAWHAAQGIRSLIAATASPPSWSPPCAASLAYHCTTATYYFRTTLVFEAAFPKYAWLNRIVPVAGGRWEASGPVYEVHEVL